MMRGLNYLPYEERLRELFSMERRRLRRNFINDYKYVKGGRQVVGVGSFRWNRTRSNGHELEHRKIKLNMRKIFFTLRVTEHWNKMSGEKVEFSFSGDIKNFIFLCNLFK